MMLDVCSNCQQLRESRVKPERACTTCSKPATLLTHARTLASQTYADSLPCRHMLVVDTLKACVRVDCQPDEWGGCLRHTPSLDQPDAGEALGERCLGNSGAALRFATETDCLVTFSFYCIRCLGPCVFLQSCGDRPVQQTRSFE